MTFSYKTWFQKGSQIFIFLIFIYLFIYLFIYHLQNSKDPKNAKCMVC